MSKKVAILQSNYIPWKGYFDIIAHVDEFILYDEVQFTKRDWRNRNKIKTPQGLQWLTIPILSKNNLYQKINETKINGELWKKKHWNSLKVNYKKTKYYEEVSTILFDFYHQKNFRNLSDSNSYLIYLVCEYLKIDTKISSSSILDLAADKNQRLVSICEQVNADIYITGKKAQNYIDLNYFNNSGIKVEWFDYEAYPEYDQQWGDFIHQVTILDLLFNCGKNSTSFMKISK